MMLKLQPCMQNNPLSNLIWMWTLHLRHLILQQKNTNVQLNWSPSQDNVGVVVYNVYQDGSVVATTSETEHKLLGSVATYFVFFGVSAVDAEGNESGISTLQVTTGEDETPDTTPPTHP
jgi:hypothetical protein